MTESAASRGDTLALARVLQLASSASPVGSFAWSDGLEHAVAAGDVHDEASAREWIAGLLAHGVCALDLPLLAGMHVAWSGARSEDALAASAWLLACRETAELRAADRAQGQAMLRVLATLQVSAAGEALGDARAGYACAFALACSEFGVTVDAAGVAYAYAWLENLVLAAVKLVPLGQSAGQRIIFELAATLPEACAAAPGVERDDIAAGAPGQAMASALHETQATRLYRS